MSQDIIRTLRPAAHNAPALPDAWGGGTTSLAQAPPAELAPQPLQKIHRLLRGRYLLAIGLGLFGALAGGLYGWFSQVPQYRSAGVIEIKPIVINSDVNRGDSVIPFYSNYMKTQTLNLKAPSLIEQALLNDEWKKAGGPAMSVAAVLANLDAEYVNNSFNIVITYESPDRKLASAFIRALLSSYENQRRNTTSVDVQDEIQKLENKLVFLSNDVNKTSTDKRAIAAQHDGMIDLASILEPLIRQRTQLDGQLSDTTFRREQAEAALKARQAEGARELTPEALAGQDPFLKTLLDNRATIKYQIAKAQQNYGQSHPYVRSLQREMELTQSSIDSQVEQLRKQQVAIVTDLAGQESIITPALVDQLRQTEARLRVVLNDVGQRVAVMARDQGKLGADTDKLDELTKQIEATERKLESRKAEAVSSGGIYRPVDLGSQARITNDGRRKMAMLGTAAGGLIPFSLVLLWGLLDSRFRYSDEATSRANGNPTLLGILPNLPDRLSDPNQASIAAHCVHQIRTMLQLNAIGDEPGAFAITSATSGDGKTSLSLALGLSFAASGSRTLLIDTDLVGAGLSARLEVHDDQGVVEALQTGDLMSHVRETDVADLALLPVGNAGAHHAGNFSPAVMRKLIAEAKKHFEIILIDTGPLLGSIEATPVAAAVDGVILAVARGQSRPMVDKALAHLRHIGATLAGVVFNRAQARDFEQSINGMSMASQARSQPRNGANGTNGSSVNGNGRYQSRPNNGDGTLGPIAHAVASQGRGEN